ncbi:MAG: hypothetical protein WCK97_02740 [Actinomycetes bacterium]
MTRRLLVAALTAASLTSALPAAALAQEGNSNAPSPVLIAPDSQMYDAHADFVPFPQQGNFISAHDADSHDGYGIGYLGSPRIGTMRIRIDDGSWTVFDREYGIGITYLPPVTPIIRFIGLSDDLRTSFVVEEPLAEGPHTVAMTETDANGNTSEPMPFNFTVDRIAPSAPTFTDGPPSVTTAMRTSIAFDSEPGSHTWCKWQDDTPGVNWQWQQCTSPAVSEDMHGLSGLRVKLEVRAVDAAGNPGPVAEYEFVRNNPIPKPTEPTIRMRHYDRNSARFDFDQNMMQIQDRFECSFDSAENFTPCASPIRYDALADGEHEFRVRAVSKEGVASDPAAQNFLVGPPTDYSAPSPPPLVEATVGAPLKARAAVRTGSPSFRVQGSSITLTTPVELPRRGRLEQSVTLGSGKTTRCEAPAATRRAGKARIRCTLGKTARAAVRAGNVIVRAETRFTPTSGAASTARDTVTIPRTR